MNFLYSTIAAAVSLGVGFGAGWYVKGRGITGVKIDASNAVKETEAVATAVKTAV